MESYKILENPCKKIIWGQHSSLLELIICINLGIKKINVTFIKLKLKIIIYLELHCQTSLSIKEIIEKQKKLFYLIHQQKIFQFISYSHCQSAKAIFVQ